MTDIAHIFHSSCNYFCHDDIHEEIIAIQHIQYEETVIEIFNNQVGALLPIRAIHAKRCEMDIEDYKKTFRTSHTIMNQEFHEDYIDPTFDDIWCITFIYENK